MADGLFRHCFDSGRVTGITEHSWRSKLPECRPHTHDTQGGRSSDITFEVSHRIYTLQLPRMRLSGFDLVKVAVCMLSGYEIVLVCSVLEFLAGIILPVPDLSLQKAWLGPTLAVPLCVAVWAGCRFGATLPRFASRLAFVLPLVVAVWELSTWTRYTYSGENVATTIRENFLTSRCGSSDCLEELFITAPLFSSVAFTIASEIGHFARRLKLRRIETR
jgi:hypothetical protein